MASESLLGLAGRNGLIREARKGRTPLAAIKSCADEAREGTKASGALLPVFHWESQMSDKRARSQENEGEGNKRAAREFNEAERRFVESGGVADKAREAERALDGPEREELKSAEEIGKSRAAGDDPAVGRSTGTDDEKIRLRAYEIWEGAGHPDGEAEAHWLQAQRELHGK